MQQQRRAEGREVIPIVKEASSLDAIRVSVVDLSYCVVETWCLDGRKDRRKSSLLYTKTVPPSLRNQKEIENPVDPENQPKTPEGAECARVARRTQ